MNYSRKQLERLGEPLGDSVTRAKLGGGYVCGGGGGSSKSATTTSTTNIDRRQVVDTGSIGISSDSSTVHIESMDAGIVNKALEFATAADATAGEGFDRLLNLTEALFDTGGQLIDKTAATSMAAVSAVETARNDAQGDIDQKTLVILAAAGLGAAWLLKGK